MKATLLEPEIVTRKGKPVSVILPIKAYEELIERLEDAEDAAWLKHALDLLCHLVFNTHVLTLRKHVFALSTSIWKRDGVHCLVPNQASSFIYFGKEGVEILNDLLHKYEKDVELQLTLPKILKLPPISNHFILTEII